MYETGLNTKSAIRKDSWQW